MKSAPTLLIAIAALGATAALAASAPDYPQRPVRLVLGFAPGGTSDALARTITPRLFEALGHPWIVDNRGGASGNLATEIVAKANPDGHTVLLALSSQITTSPLLYRLPFNVGTDLRPVNQLASSQYMLVIHPSVKANNISEFVEAAKAQRGALNYASVGIGSPHHLAAELFKLRAGVSMTHVPYKGGGPASAAILANEVQVLFGSLASLHPHVKTGRIKALGMTGTSRSAEAPDVPTIAEAGFPGFDVTSWFGFLVPAHTPDRIVNAIHATTAKILAMPEVREAAGRAGLEVVVKGPQEFAAYIKAEAAMWTELIRNTNIRVEQ